MTLHICRDFNNYGTTIPLDNQVMYSLSMFLRTIMGFTVVGQTNFDLAGSFSLAEGSGATAASINQGGLDVYAVAIPLATYTLTGADVNRVLALRSSTNPKFNTGLFRIINVDSVNNWAIIDYRSSTQPPVDSTLAWAIYVNEDTITFNTTDNGAGGGQYETRTTAACSRIILSSPSGWQVRLTQEGSTDVSAGAPALSIIPGTGGDSSGDFQVGGDHLHPYLFNNLTTSNYRNNCVGVASTTTGGVRTYMWGDTDTETIIVLVRDAGSSVNTFIAFGLTEDEEPSTPEYPLSLAQRLFVIGDDRSNVSSDNMILYFGFQTDGAGLGGSAFGLSNRPVSCVLSQYTPIVFSGDISTYNSVTTGHPIFRTIARDNPYTKQIELLTLDVVAGTWDNRNSSAGSPIFNLEARRIGTLPMMRQGRVIGNFQVSTDSNRSWLHARNGIYLPWEGPLILP